MDLWIHVSLASSMLLGFSIGITGSLIEVQYNNKASMPYVFMYAVWALLAVLAITGVVRADYSAFSDLAEKTLQVSTVSLLAIAMFLGNSLVTFRNEYKKTMAWLVGLLVFLIVLSSITSTTVLAVSSVFAGIGFLFFGLRSQATAKKQQWLRYFALAMAACFAIFWYAITHYAAVAPYDLVLASLPYDVALTMIGYKLGNGYYQRHETFFDLGI